MAVTLTGVALPGLYSAVPLEPASCPVPHFLLGPPAPILCPRPNPSSCSCLCTSSSSSGAADPKEQQKGYYFGPEARDALDNGTHLIQVTLPPLMAVAHERNIGPSVFLMLRAQGHLGWPAPVAYLEPEAHSGLPAVPGPDPLTSSPPGLGRTPVAAPHQPKPPTPP